MDWLALCGVRFWAWADALVLLEQERAEWGISSVAVMTWVIGAEAIERA